MVWCVSKLGLWSRLLGAVSNRLLMTSPELEKMREERRRLPPIISLPGLHPPELTGVEADWLVSAPSVSVETYWKSETSAVSSSYTTKIILVICCVPSHTLPCDTLIGFHLSDLYRNQRRFSFKNHILKHSLI